jgi:paraquat-inducible protein A
VIKRVRTACQGCGAIIDIHHIDDEAEYACPRCESVFYRPGESFVKVLAMIFSSTLFLIPALFIPVMTIQIMGNAHSISLIEAVWFFAVDGYILIALITTFLGVILPLTLYVLMLMMIIPSMMGQPARLTSPFFRLFERFRHWSMAEVYLVSIFVGIIKLNDMADLQLNYGLVSFSCFLITFYIALNWFNPEDIWNR